MFSSRIVKSFENTRIPNRHFTNVFNDIVSPEAHEQAYSEFDESDLLGNISESDEWDDVTQEIDLRNIINL